MTLGELKSQLANLDLDDDDQVSLMVGEDSYDITDIFENEDTCVITLAQA